MNPDRQAGKPRMVGIDWLTVRFPKTTSPAIHKEIVSGQDEPKDISPAYFCERGREYKSGVRLYGWLRDDYWVYTLDGSTLTGLYKDNVKVVSWLMRMLQHGANITRLDLTWDVQDKGELAKSEAALWVKGKRKENQRTVELRFKPDRPDEGCTIYEGVRQSDIYIRLYDKFAESHKQEPYSRFEAELKGDVAKAITARLKVLSSAGNVKDVANGMLAILADIGNESALCGHLPLWKSYWGCQEITSEKLEIIRAASSLEKWIVKSVLPALIKDVLQRGEIRGSWFEFIEYEIHRASKAIDARNKK